MRPLLHRLVLLSVFVGLPSPALAAPTGSVRVPLPKIHRETAMDRWLMRRSALREFRSYLRQNENASAAWKAAKKSLNTGIVRTGTITGWASTALFWTAAVVMPSPITFGAAVLSTDLMGRATRIERDVRSAARTAAISTAIEQGQSPSRGQLRRWAKAGIIADLTE